MPITLQNIADAAGVSRGTVDRALNNRGRIRPEVAAKIQKIAKEMGYQPSLAGRALVMSKNKFKIGMIIRSMDTPFMRAVAEGAEEAKIEFERLGITVDIRKMDGINTVEIAESLSEMIENGYSGIALNGVSDRTIKQLINKSTDEYNIPIVTFNADVPDCSRLCYVGQDTAQSGRVAAGLMSEILKEGTVAMIADLPENSGVNTRVNAFADEMKTVCPNVNVLDLKFCYADNRVAEQLLYSLIDENSDLAGIYVAASGVVGICRALEKWGLGQKIKLIVNDTIPDNIYWLKKGYVNFLVGQQAHSQGYDPIKIIFNKLMENEEPHDYSNYEDILITTKYNI